MNAQLGNRDGAQKFIPGHEVGPGWAGFGYLVAT